MNTEFPSLVLRIIEESIAKELDAPYSGDAGLFTVHNQLEHILKISGRAFECPFSPLPAGACDDHVIGVSDEPVTPSRKLAVAFVQQDVCQYGPEVPAITRLGEHRVLVFSNLPLSITPALRNTKISLLMSLSSMPLSTSPMRMSWSTVSKYFERSRSTTGCSPRTCRAGRVSPHPLHSGSACSRS